ncbi:uncharacterized protein [Ptychodera flava]|uniref:uncharacterized protein n=1 Tax=Ptychodera flava TaxID=63121 RepID=UPI003969FBBD
MDFKTVFVFLTIIAAASACWGGSNGPSRPSGGTWPSFSTMWNNYPSYSRYSSEELIRKCKLRDWLLDLKPKLNTCAIRVSNSLISSGKTLNDLSGCNWSGTTTTDGDKYIIRVATMRCYLENKKGSADVISSYESAFRGREGIIVFQGCSFATGSHVDLWDGYTCAGQCYFSACNNNRLFEW